MAHALGGRGRLSEFKASMIYIVRLSEEKMDVSHSLDNLPSAVSKVAINST